MGRSVWPHDAASRVPWVRPVRQERSQQTLDRLVEAAEDLLADYSFEDISVQQLVERGQSSVGSFYARFENKDAFLAYLHQRFHDMVLLTADAQLQPERWRGADLATTVRAIMADLVAAHREYAGPMRAFTMRAGADPAFREREEDMNHRLSERISAVVLSHRDEIRHPHPDAAVDFAVVFTLGALLQRIFFGVRGPGRVQLDDDAFAAELTRAFLGYLGVNETRKENGN